MILLWTNYNGRDLGSFDGEFGSREVWSTKKAGEKQGESKLALTLPDNEAYF